MVRDNITNRNGVHAAFIRVAGNGTDAASCELFSLTQFGVTLAQSASVSTTSRDCVSLSTPLGVSANLGSYVYNCALPPGGSVCSYRVDEFNPTNRNN